jgi:hypothetical protein
MGDRADALAFCVDCWYVLCEERGWNYGDPWAGKRTRGGAQHGLGGVYVFTPWYPGKHDSPHWTIDRHGWLCDITHAY